MQGKLYWYESPAIQVGGGTTAIVLVDHVQRRKSSLDLPAVEDWIQQTSNLNLLLAPSVVLPPGSAGAGGAYVEPSGMEASQILQIVRRRKNWNLNSQMAMDPSYDGSPEALILPFPDPNLILLLGDGGNPELYGFPYTNFLKKRKMGTILASRAMDDVPLNAFILGRPASSYSIVPANLLSEIQRHMLEGTIDGGITWSLWTQQQVLNYLNERLSKFLVDTGLIYNIATISVTANINNYDLPNDLIEIRRITWSSGGSTYTLLRSDQFQEDANNPGWSVNAGVPYAYVEFPTGTKLQLIISPLPNANGTISVYYIQEPITFTPLNLTTTYMPLPNTFCQYIKYGVMADMMKQEGEANDPQRSTYFEQRYSEGIELARALLGYNIPQTELPSGGGRSQ